jgi:DNA-binding response OmpR family regulator
MPKTDAGGGRWMNADSGSRLNRQAGRRPPTADRPVILVVDDDPTFCDIMGEILRMYQAHVFTAFSARKALPSRKVTPDLIHRAMMPEVDGLTFVRRQSGAAQTRIPIIIVSAGVSHREQVAAMQAGADQFLPKPFSITDLRAAVGSLLPT